MNHLQLLLIFLTTANVNYSYKNESDSPVILIESVYNYDYTDVVIKIYFASDYEFSHIEIAKDKV